MLELSDSVRRARAIDLTDLNLRAMGARRLHRSELDRFAKRGMVAGWQLEISFSDAPRCLSVLVDERFPRSQPRVALVDPPPFLTWAHVEHDGLLCLLNGGSSIDPALPVDGVKVVLGEACDLIESLIHGSHEDDFRAEFLSYWEWGATPGSRPVRSLLLTQGPSRPIRLWRGRDQYVVGETDDSLHSWLGGLGLDKRRVHLESGLLFWCDKPLIPAQFPHSANDILRVIGDEERKQLLGEIEVEPAELLVVLGAPALVGACFGAVTIKRSSGPGYAPRPLTQGFRPDHIPPRLLAQRYLSRAVLQRLTVERVDRAWVHGRDQDARQSELAGAVVTILGCGSIGSEVAVRLAQAGTGKIRLVDPQFLVSGNPGRHSLGVNDLGHYKSVALARRLRERFPHLIFEPFPCRWEELDDAFGLFTESTLIVSAIGDWAAEGALNATHVANGTKAPIVYGWTEPHACAGHAVRVDLSGGCFQCGIDRHGACLFPATDWGGKTQLKREPACGGEFQPYGAVELGFVVSMVAEQALDTLLHNTREDDAHRIWLAGEHRIQQLGGRVAPALSRELPSAARNGFVHYRSWAPRMDCPECKPSIIKAA